jgi:hypothetical protein
VADLSAQKLEAVSGEKPWKTNKTVNSKPPSWAEAASGAT